MTRCWTISVAFEKISEIEDAARWLTDHGLPDEFFKKVHHKVPDANDIFYLLKDAPVILHTHHKLKRSSYLDEYFKYKGNLRKLFIFDESMLNSMVSSDLTTSVVSRIERFIREYDLVEEFRLKIDAEIYEFFKELKELIDQLEGKRATSKQHQGNNTTCQHIPSRFFQIPQAGIYSQNYRSCHW